VDGIAEIAALASLLLPPAVAIWAIGSKGGTPLSHASHLSPKP
jgi:hypothetical protein